MLFVTFLAVAVAGCGSSRSASSDEASHAQAVHSDDGADAEVIAALAELPDEDRLAAAAQRYCAVMMESRLGSMGAPFKLTIEGQSVFLCCEGCKDTALGNPQQTLANVSRLKEADAERQ
jgi:Cu(I)/Ag(I) efflux system membrane fusion protein